MHCSATSASSNVAETPVGRHRGSGVGRRSDVDPTPPLGADLTGVTALNSAFEKLTVRPEPASRRQPMCAVMTCWRTVDEHKEVL
jgi:hypothetical protein